MLSFCNKNNLNSKGQSSFEILFVTIVVILLAGILYYFTLGNTKEISNMGVVKTEVESFFVENNLQITVSNIDLAVNTNLVQAKIKLSKSLESIAPGQFAVLYYFEPKSGERLIVGSGVIA